MHVLLGFFCAVLGAAITFYLMRGASLLRMALCAFGVSYTLYIVAVLPLLYGG
jgi:hypothetical protein